MQTFSGVSVSFAKFRRSGPVRNFLPSHLPFGNGCIFPLSRSYDPLPLQNLASHNLVSRRQSVVVLTVKMVDDFKCLQDNVLVIHLSLVCPSKGGSGNLEELDFVNVGWDFDIHNDK